jgi:hypothetical protein
MNVGTGTPLGGLVCVGYASPKCTDRSLEIGFCYYGSNESACTSAYYGVGEALFPCASCLPSDLEACKAQATTACVGGPGDAGALE